MKKSFFLTAIATLFVLSACNKLNTDPQMDCSGNCIFALAKAKGTITYMQCFDRFAIKAMLSDEVGASPIYGLPDELDSQFEVEGLEVEFSASFRSNQLTPSFPDSTIEMGSLFQIELAEIGSSY
ncbi:MAG: hypothetical protein IPN76_14690 [Saprospiraceae bacterium]|nr:hypothetical protein [Saprospiraceae bacterium]